jgi:hypothetical protein
MFRRNRIIERAETTPSITAGLTRGVRLLRNHLSEWPRRYVEMRIGGRIR